MGNQKGHISLFVHRLGTIEGAKMKLKKLKYDSPNIKQETSLQSDSFPKLKGKR